MANVPLYRSPRPSSATRSSVRRRLLIASGVSGVVVLGAILGNGPSIPGTGRGAGEQGNTANGAPSAGTYDRPGERDLGPIIARAVAAKLLPADIPGGAGEGTGTSVATLLRSSSPSLDPVLERPLTLRIATSTNLAERQFDPSPDVRLEPAGNVEPAVVAGLTQEGGAVDSVVESQPSTDGNQPPRLIGPITSSAPALIAPKVRSLGTQTMGPRITNPNAPVLSSAPWQPLALGREDSQQGEAPTIRSNPPTLLAQSAVSPASIPDLHNGAPQISFTGASQTPAPAKSTSVSPASAGQGGASTQISAAVPPTPWGH
jgi:hypothetical protein